MEVYLFPAGLLGLGAWGFWFQVLAQRFGIQGLGQLGAFQHYS